MDPMSGRRIGRKLSYSSIPPAGFIARLPALRKYN